MKKKELQDLRHRVKVSLRGGKWTDEAQILNIVDPRYFRNILDELSVDALGDLVRGVRRLYLEDTDVAKYLRRKYSTLRPELILAEGYY